MINIDLERMGKQKLFGRIREGTVHAGGGTMHYLSFGRGDFPLVIIPGLSDGQRTVKGSGLIMAYFYRSFARHYRVWVFSRKKGN